MYNLHFNILRLYCFLRAFLLPLAGTYAGGICNVGRDGRVFDGSVVVDPHNVLEQKPTPGGYGSLGAEVLTHSPPTGLGGRPGSLRLALWSHFLAISRRCHRRIESGVTIVATSASIR